MKHPLSLFISFMMLFPCCFAQTGWVQLNSGTTQNLRGITFTSPDVGYVVGELGTILKTTDGGNNWISQTVGFAPHFSGVYFLNQDTGFVYGWNIICKTINGGTNWVYQFLDDGGINDMEFINDTLGYFVGGGCDQSGISDDTCLISKTLNGGNSWNSSNWEPTPLTDHNIEIQFVHASIGYVVGNADGPSTKGRGQISKSVDAGVSWRSQFVAYNQYDEYELYSLYVFNSVTCYASGEGGNMIKTNDGGASWSKINSPTTYNLNSIVFPSSSIGYAVGASGTIIKTKNSGTIWGKQSSGVNVNLKKTFFTDTIIGYAIGNNGTILKTIDGGGSTDFDETDESSIIPYELLIYPNPVNDECKIIFSNPFKNLHRIEITDVRGALVFKDNIVSNTYTLKTNMLQSGMYFISIIGDRIFWEKLVVY